MREKRDIEIAQRASLLQVVHRVSSSLLGPVDLSFRALSGRLKFTVRRHKFNEDSPSSNLRRASLLQPQVLGLRLLLYYSQA